MFWNTVFCNVILSCIWAFNWYRNRWPRMTVIALILRYFPEELDRLGGQLRHSGWRQTYKVWCRISSSSHIWPKLTHASVVRSLRQLGFLLFFYSAAVIARNAERCINHSRSVCRSVRPSVTFRCLVQMSHTVMRSSVSGSTTTLTGHSHGITPFPSDSVKVR